MDKQTAKLVARIAENLPEMDEVLMQGWIENPKGLQKILKDALCPSEKLVRNIDSTYRDQIDYSRSIVDLVKAGKYDQENDAIMDENFPSAEIGKKEVEIALFHFNRDISAENAIIEMKKAGYRPATMKELLNFGEKHPEVQREFPVVELGSVAELEGHRRAGYIRRCGSGRGVDLYCFSYNWAGYFRFLAVRN